MAPMWPPEAHFACQLSGSDRCGWAELRWMSYRRGETGGFPSLFWRQESLLFTAPEQRSKWPSGGRIQLFIYAAVLGYCTFYMKFFPVSVLFSKIP